MVAEYYIRRRIEQRASLNADQAEFAAIVRSSAIVDEGTYDDRVSGALDDFDPGLVADQLEAWHETDLVSDALVGETQLEIERRLDLLKTAYPFELKGNNLRYCPSKTRYYEFCLATTLSPNIVEGRFAQLPRMFERTVADLIKEYMGWRSTALHVGWPRDEQIGVRFKQAMETLNKLSGEWSWNPQEQLPNDPNPAQVKDEGVDIIVWKEALDRRNGHLFFLCQCACGNDWRDKITELNLQRFVKWFHPSCRVPPIRTFATPYILSDGNMDDALDQGGFVLDRVRLTLIAEENVHVAAIAAMPQVLSPLSALVLKPA